MNVDTLVDDLGSMNERSKSTLAKIKRVLIIIFAKRAPFFFLNVKTMLRHISQLGNTFISITVIAATTILDCYSIE